jgi:hypothetical protein
MINSVSPPRSVSHYHPLLFIVTSTQRHLYLYNCASNRLLEGGGRWKLHPNNTNRKNKSWKPPQLSEGRRGDASPLVQSLLPPGAFFYLCLGNEDDLTWQFPVAEPLKIPFSRFCSLPVALKQAVFLFGLASIPPSPWDFYGHIRCTNSVAFSPQAKYTD